MLESGLFITGREDIAHYRSAGRTHFLLSPMFPCPKLTSQRKWCDVKTKGPMPNAVWLDQEWFSTTDASRCIASCVRERRVRQPDGAGSDDQIMPDHRTYEDSAFITPEQRRGIYFNNAARLLRSDRATIAADYGR